MKGFIKSFVFGCAVAIASNFAFSGLAHAEFQSRSVRTQVEVTEVLDVRAAKDSLRACGAARDEACSEYGEDSDACDFWSNKCFDEAFTFLIKAYEGKMKIISE